MRPTVSPTLVGETPSEGMGMKLSRSWVRLPPDCRDVKTAALLRDVHGSPPTRAVVGSCDLAHRPQRYDPKPD